MVPERKRNGNFIKEREIHGESNMLITAETLKKRQGLDVDTGLV